VRARLPLLILIAGAGCAPAPAPSAPTARAGLPSVALLTLDGRATRLDAALEGHAGLVSLWATWCEACGEEFDSLARLDERARRRGGRVIAVAVGEPRATVAEFVARRGLRYSQLVDEEFHFADALGQRRVPATLVIDRAGRVVFTGGSLDAPALDALRTLLD
jgi:peroxiredoxin